MFSALDLSLAIPNIVDESRADISAKWVKWDDLKFDNESLTTHFMKSSRFLHANKVPSRIQLENFVFLPLSITDCLGLRWLKF